MVPPCTFIPIAEKYGLIIPLGEWALRNACREAVSWPQPLTIAVNVSPDPVPPRRSAELVHAILLETGLPPERLILEIAEGVLINDFFPGAFDPLPAQGDWRADCPGRFRPGLFVAGPIALVPIRQDQGRPRLHFRSRNAIATQWRLCRGHRPRPQPQDLDLAEGVESRSSGRSLFRPGAMKFRDTSPATLPDRRLCRTHRPDNRAAPGCRRSPNR